jgi:integrase
MCKGAIIAQNTAKKTRNKPKKPTATFPLFAASNGQWAKKIRGAKHYFGVWSDPAAALAKYHREAIHLHAGEPVPDPQATPTAPSTMTVKDAANHFLSSRQRLVESGELTPRSLADYFRTCETIIKYFGKEKPLDKISLTDLEGLRAHLAKTRKAVALGNEVQRSRTFLSYPFAAELVAAPVRFGNAFRRPSSKAMRGARNARGEVTFTPAEIHAMLAATDPQLKCMILLGLSCAMGNNDLSSLPMSAISADRKWITFPRPKTQIPRRLPIWPEVTELLPQVIATRIPPKDPADEGLLFVTRCGHRWVRNQRPKKEMGNVGSARVTVIDGVAQQFRKLMVALDMRQHRRGFYVLRHLTQTIGEQAGDPAAVAAILGHAPRSHDMASVYRISVNDERLLAVSKTIHDWLWPESAKPAKKTRPR